MYNRVMVRPGEIIRTFRVGSEVKAVVAGDFIGQEKIKQCIKILIQSAQLEDQTVSSILYSGTSGGGKTTLAHIISNEIGSNIFLANGGVIKKPKDILSYLCKL